MRTVQLQHHTLRAVQLQVQLLQIMVLYFRISQNYRNQKKKFFVRLIKEQIQQHPTVQTVQVQHRLVRPQQL